MSALYSKTLLLLLGEPLRAEFSLSHRVCEYPERDDRSRLQKTERRNLA